MKKITIQQLRGIQKLQFDFPTADEGILLLTGINGAGKSTLMTCISRIGIPDIFQTVFVPSVFFANASIPAIFHYSSITYETEEGVVEFHYDAGRWKTDASPALQERIFSSFHFSKVIYAGGHPKSRVSARNLSVDDVRVVPQVIRDAMCDIFDEEKFKHMYYIVHSATKEVIYLIQEQQKNYEYYYSENDFSRGERAVTHLATQLSTLPKHSLILLDESEMALHPKAQKRLLSYLRKFCSINHCLCIVSTQSASLIKITDPKKILFLDNAEDGTLICRNNVYPAAILGELAFSEEILPEVIILVEDHEAAMLMEEIVNKLKMTMNVDFPYCKILPVGGYLQVVHLLDNLSRVFPDYVKKRAVLDKDAEPQLQKMNKDAFRSQHSVVSRNYENLYFLPCTPEQGVITLLENNPDKKSQELNQVFQSDLIRLSDVFSDERYRAISGDSRSDCKDKMELLVHYLLRLFSEPEYYIKRKLYKYYIQKRYPDTGVLKKEYCEIIFKN